MNCASCGAPLRPHNPKCPYCQTLNDVDLRSVHGAAPVDGASDRVCPVCDVVMETISLGGHPSFSLERCTRCLGIFFDPGELEALLEAHAGATSIDHEKLRVFVAQQPADDLHDQKVRSTYYLKCPVCRHLMLRRGFGGKSTVIADECRKHGVWLDGGELGRLVRWSRSGGLVYVQQRQAEARREAERQRRSAQVYEAAEAMRGGGPYGSARVEASPLGLALRLFFELLSLR